jgi:hypothetical protein
LKKSICSSFAVLFTTALCSQTLTWSPTIVQPKEKNAFTALQFAGISNGQYVVNEAEAGGVSFDRKVKGYLHYIDMNSLVRVKQQFLNSTAAAGDEKNFVDAGSFVMGGKAYAFFVNRTDKKIHSVHGTAQPLSAGSEASAQLLFKMDLSKSDIASKTKFYASLVSAYNVTIQPSYDKKTILAAYVSETLDKDNSLITVTEMDENLKTISSNHYSMPYKAYQKMTKSIVGALPEGDAIDPVIYKVYKDKSGFVYVFYYSAIPNGDKDDRMFYWVAQVKPSDPSYMKLYQQEFSKSVAIVDANLFQSEDGQVMLGYIGKEIEKKGDRNEKYWVNHQYIGRFNTSGELEPVASGRIPSTTLYHFESEKKVDKRGGAVNSLRLSDIKPTSDGGCYVIWQHFWEEEKVDNKGNFYISSYHLDNGLVQYYTKPNKLSWEKTIHKNQETKMVVGSFAGYSGLKSFLSGDNLIVFYADDIKNAQKGVDEDDVANYSVIKFGGKDLSGFFVAKFDRKGNYTRKYMSWPEDKLGFALNVNSIWTLDNNEFIGTVRKISQGVFLLKSEEFTFFKLKL